MTSRGKTWFNKLLLPSLPFVLGVTTLLSALYADVHHTTIWRGRDAALMEPWQGYLAAFFCFVATAYTLAAALRTKNGDDI